MTAAAVAVFFEYGSVGMRKLPFQWMFFEIRTDRYGYVVDRELVWFGFRPFERYYGPTCTWSLTETVIMRITK